MTGAGVHRERGPTKKKARFASSASSFNQPIEYHVFRYQSQPQHVIYASPESRIVSVRFLSSSPRYSVFKKGRHKKRPKKIGCPPTLSHVAGREFPAPRCRRNVKFVKDAEQRTARVMTLREIQAGEELYAEYGDGYWRHHSAGTNPAD